MKGNLHLVKTMFKVPRVVEEDEEDEEDEDML